MPLFFLLFLSLIIAWNGFFRSFSHKFLDLNSRSLEKKVFFCLVVRGVYPPYTLSGPTTKKITFFMCVFPNWLSHICHFKQNSYGIYTLFASYQIMYWRIWAKYKKGFPKGEVMLLKSCPVLWRLPQIMVGINKPCCGHLNERPFSRDPTTKKYSLQTLINPFIQYQFIK